MGRYLSFHEEMQKRFGRKVYKLSLDAGMTCPNRDGRSGYGGCIFCDGGSGAFAARREISLQQQIEQAKARIRKKAGPCPAYMAYFQSYTNTYAPVERLEELFMPVAAREDICALSIATRPDCLPVAVLDLLTRLNSMKPVFVELGLQTIHEKTAEYIRRGYPLEVFDRAVAEKLVLSVYGHSLLDGALREGLQAHCNCPMEEMRLGPVLGIHLGDSAIGVAWIEKKR